MSAPGPNGVPYIVYKRCPGVLKLLWKTLRAVWKRGRVADQWRQAEGVWIPKEELSKTIDQFRIISLLNTEGKMFFGILSRRLSNFLLKNNYIDTSVQKGGVAGMPGCIEHTGVVSQLIREAKENKGNLAVLWLDLANAYGSIPHKLVEEALRRHHVPSSISALILDYYNNFMLRVTSGTTTSNWHRLERGIITGCTISATLFSLAMNMIVKSAEMECRGPVAESGVRQPPLRAYMDDITVMTAEVTGSKWILRGLEKHIAWARMKFKPGKSRSLVLQKGKVNRSARFKVAGETIPTITEKPVKSLGKWFDGSMKDHIAIKRIGGDLEGWLTKIDKSGLPGTFKAWIYQHAVLPRILWPLLLYEVAVTTVETMERKVSGYLRRWLGLPRNLSSAALYGSTNAVQLPFKGLKEEFLVTRTREAIMYRDSKDPKVSGAGIEIRTGRKWCASRELQVAEERLRQKALVGTVARGTTGLGYFSSPRIESAKGKERRELLQKEVRAGVEEARITKMVGQSQQGAWTRWEQFDRQRVTWSDLWRCDLSFLKFRIQAVYDVLPSPSNLHKWGKSDSPACPLCGGRGSLQHLLSGCGKMLGDGRYRWRHDQVLKAIAEVVSEAVKSNKFQPGRRKIDFVKAGSKKQPRPKSKVTLLSSAQDWQLLVDVGRQMKFPAHIADTRLRPDIIVFSNSAKRILMFELTCPWEENMESAHERKIAKYEHLVKQCQSNGWQASCQAVEVGCRGFTAWSLSKALSSIGVTGATKRKALKNITDAAQKATRWLWLKRADIWGVG